MPRCLAFQRMFRWRSPRSRLSKWWRRAIAFLLTLLLSGAWPLMERRSGWAQDIKHPSISTKNIVFYEQALPEVDRLNQQIAELSQQRQYSDAVPLAERVLQIQEQTFGSRSQEVATSINNLANLYRGQWNYTQSEQLYQRALAIREQLLGASHPDVAQSLNDLANLYCYLRPFFYKPELSRTDRRIRRENEAEIEHLYKRALTIREQTLGHNHVDVAQSLSDMAYCYSRIGLGEPEQWKSLSQRAITIREQLLGVNHPDVARSLIRLAEISGIDAESSYRRAIAIQERTLGVDHIDVAHSLIELAAELLFNADNLNEVEALRKRAITILEQSDGTVNFDFPQSLKGLGERYADLRIYAVAIELKERALIIKEQLLKGDYSSLDADRSRLRGLYEDQGDFSGLVHVYERALAIHDQSQTENYPRLLNHLTNLIGAHYSQGSYGEIDQLVLRAIEAWQQMGPEEIFLSYDDTLTLVAQISGLAQRYYLQKNYRAVNSLHARLVAIREQFEDCEAYLYQVNSATGELFLERIDEIQSQMDTYQSLWRAVLYELTPQFYALKNNSLTLRWLNYAIQTDSSRLTGFLQGVREENMRYYAETLRDLTSMVISLRLQGGDSGSLATQVSTNAVLQFKGRVLDAATDNFQRLRQQLELNNRLLGEIESISSQIANLQFAQSPEVTLEVRTAQIAELEQRSQNLEREIAEQLTPEHESLLLEFIAIRSTLTDLPDLWNQINFSHLQGSLEEYRAYQIALEQRSQELERILIERKEEFRPRTQLVTFNMLQPLIPDDAALVEIMLYRPFNPGNFTPVLNWEIGFKYSMLQELWQAPHYAAYVLHRSGDPQWIDLGAADAIDSQVEALRQGLRSPTQNPRLAARQLDKLVMQPIRSLLGNTTHLLISPDSQLNLIPFAALVDERDRYLLETYRFTYLTSGRDLLKLQLNAPSRQAPVLFANPDYDDPGSSTIAAIARRSSPTADRSSPQRSSDITSLRFGALPGTQTEAAAIAPLFPSATVLTGSQATENTLKQLQAPSILHLATHGFFLEDVEFVPPPETRGDGTITAVFTGDRPSPRSTLRRSNENPLLRSGLALAGFNTRHGGGNEDGVLTALEVSNLDLSGTQLVVLSACETGLGDVINGEGVYGLRRAFVMAGAESQLMSLWKVSDQGTSDLMSSYYQRLQQGEDRSIALHQVQQEFLDTPSYRHPYYWAAFIFSGDWRAIDRV